MKRYWLGMLIVVGCGGSHGGGGAASGRVAPVSSSLALTSDDSQLWVVNADSDSISLVDPKARTLVAEVALGPPPMVDGQMRFDPNIAPRALAISPDDAKVYVAGQRANAVFVVDAKSRAVVGNIAVGAEPVGLVAAADGQAVYVVSHQAATVAKIDPATASVVATLPVAEHPWGASLSADGKSLFVTHLLQHAGVTVIDTATFTVRNTIELADQPADAASKLVPNGVARGVYTAVPRPQKGTSGGDIWLPHMLLAIGTAQPDLDFQSTAFPTISTLEPTATSEAKRLLFKPLTVPGATGAFNDSISGPRALAFTPDGTLAFMADSASEDVMVFDGTSGNERQLVRPVPGALLEGIVVDHAGTHAFIDGRNTHNIIALSIANGAALDVEVDGQPIERLMAADPMPAQLRLGQRLFYTANSSAYPITQNFWIACASCHLEGGSDAVTWKFAQGPRDTPSNAGGPINTGFLMRQALRNDMIDYDVTIRTEQGGLFHRDTASQLPYLEAVGAYTNYAIPLPRNPNVAADGTLTDAQTRGQATFGTLCASCHSGPFYTDSGQGNVRIDGALDMNGTILLHDIGTCVTNGPYDDQPHKDDVVGLTRTACDFDTPTLRGIFATAPYFHDGSSATLDDVVARLSFSSTLSAADQADLVAFLKTL
jgi:YVTN family beta-propeller protein